MVFVTHRPITTTTSTTRNLCSRLDPLLVVHRTRLLKHTFHSVRIYRKAIFFAENFHRVQHFRVSERTTRFTNNNALCHSPFRTGCVWIFSHKLQVLLSRCRRCIALHSVRCFDRHERRSERASERTSERRRKRNLTKFKSVWKCRIHWSLYSATTHTHTRCHFHFEMLNFNLRSFISKYISLN